jgi:cell division protease FtsH
MTPERRQRILIATAIAAILLSYFVLARFVPGSMAYSDFRAAVAAGKVTEVTVGPHWIRTRVAGVDHAVVRVEDPDLYRDLAEKHVKVTGEVESSGWGSALGWIAGGVLAWWILGAATRRTLGRQSDLLGVGRSKAKVFMEKEVKVRFDDVAGVDEAKEELEEVIEFLRAPERFRRLGARIPKGVLLVGPPGTGKTLLARAVAGEAGVPFFSISGSEFVEMFVGVGAARVRDLFQQAQAKAPCIIFVDELDALGKARGIGPVNNEEREQTLNQLLVEMDGFDPRVGVILMAATNRPEILDPALLRAGRFDRQVLVDRPDKPGRLAILKVHARSVPLENEADLGLVAGMTAGFAGADLANIVNEAALLAARADRPLITLADLQSAVERVIAGLEKRNRVLTSDERRRVATHEVGHALVALSIPGADPVQKISIIPRGIAALGYTLQVPTQDRFVMTQGELEGKIRVLLGGRIAEQLVFGDRSTGAEDDLVKATEIARAMVRNYGMSDRLGNVSFEGGKGRTVLGAPSELSVRDFGDETASAIDAEIREVLERQEKSATLLLGSKRQILAAAAEQLLVQETLSGDELRAIAAVQPAATSEAA